MDQVRTDKFEPGSGTGEALDSTLLREKAGLLLSEARATTELEVRKGLHQKSFELLRLAGRKEGVGRVVLWKPVLGYPQRPPKRRARNREETARDSTRKGNG